MYIYIYIYTQWNITQSFAVTCMDLEIVILSEVSQTEKDIICFCLYAESKKSVQMNLPTK